jgi:hypothetical protein
MFLKIISIGIIFSSLILMTSLTYQSSAAQNVTSSDVNQSPYQLLPLPQVVVISPDTSVGATNDSFIYPSPTLQLVNVPEGIDSSCYGLTVYDLVNKTTDLCYGAQINEFLKHPANQSQREQFLKQPPIPDEFLDKNMTAHFDQKYTLQFLKKSHNQQVQELLDRSENLYSTMGNQTNLQCDPDIYDDYVNPGIPRFFMIHPCISVAGNVTLVHDPSAGFDGDVVFALTLDKPYQNLVTTANFNSKMTGGIWVELICQYSNNATALVHKGDCSAGTSPKFTIPSVGDRVNVTGAYVIDIREGGHAEIHPASAMSKIP